MSKVDLVADRPNAPILRQARRARKLSTAEVAKHTGIAEARLAGFEVGRIQPSIAQLSKLSALYNVELFAFFGEQLSNISDTLPDFRKATPTAANLSPKGLTRIWQIEGQSQFVSHVEEALGRDAPKKIGTSKFTNSGTPQPAELRAGFDSWLESRDKTLRFTGQREDVFAKQLRLFLEVHACSTVYNSAPIDDYLGFYNKSSAESDIIFVNRQIKQDKRRLFTLSHEMAHYFFKEEGVSNPFVAINSVEKRCNQFAAEFLAPDDLILDLVRSAQAAPSRDVGRIVNYIAAHTLLSRQASTIRLRELELISRAQSREHLGYLSKLRNVSEPSADASASAPVGRAAAIGKKLSEVGVHASYVAATGLAKKLIDVVDIERGLGISEKLQTAVLDLASRRYEARVRTH